MNLTVIARILGYLLLSLLVAGLLPLGLDAIVGRPLGPWLWMEGLCLIVTAGMFLWGRRASLSKLGIREGVALTTASWLVFSALAGIGVWLAAPVGTTYIEGWFEAMSGFTTTGASVFGGARRIADLSPGLLLWRALMQWMGGIGIVVLTLAVMPLIGGGSGFRLYRAEVPGMDKDRLAPRIRDTARLLVRVYLGLSISVFVGLMACGGSAFDAFCHACGAVSTGGFSTFDDSAEGFRSAAAEWVLIAGMAASGLNFAIILVALRGRLRRFAHSEELRAYLLLLTGTSLIVAFATGLGSDFYRGDLHGLIRDSVFQVVTIATSTGYGTGYDSTPGGMGWDAWPLTARAALLLVMIVGGCAGSTAGGIKVARMLVALKAVRRELHRFMEPARVIPISFDGVPIRDAVVLQVSAFLFIYAASWCAGVLLLTLLSPGIDLDTAGSAALSCLSNVGPGVSRVGIAGSYAPLGGGGQGVCILLMLLGRLEFFGVLMTLWWGRGSR